MTTKKDFIAVAAIIAAEYKKVSDPDNDEAQEAFSATDTTARIAYRLADYFGAENTRFDKDRFLTACGVVEKAV